MEDTTTTTDEDTTPEEQAEVDATVQDLLRPAQSHGVGDVRQVVLPAAPEGPTGGAPSGEVVLPAAPSGGAPPSGDGKPRIIPGEAPPKAKKKVPKPLVEVETKRGQ